MSVELINISKIFKNPDHPEKELVAVKEVNLKILDGEMVTLLGPSGCGKTTTLRIISGFEIPSRGEIWIEGKNVNNLPPNKRDTSMVFQSYAIFPHLSVSQNIGFGLELKGWKSSLIKNEVEKIMEIMNLKDMYNRRPDQLSGGQQQRVALARAIINKPKVLLFDEPLSNLDAKLREQMRVEIRRIQQSFKITSIYVTHDQAEAMTVSDRIVVMNNGEIMQIGTPFDIYSRPSNVFVADFIGRVNIIEGFVKKIEKDMITIDYKTGVKKINNNSLKVKDNQSILTIIRPESLIVKKIKEINSSVLRGEITKIVYLGPTVEYEIKVKDRSRTICAVIYNPIESGFFKHGEDVGINFNSESVHLLSDTNSQDYNKVNSILHEDLKVIKN